MKRPLFWHQGLFLQPQHFQRLEQYVRTLLEPYQACMQPHFWGVASQVIQEAALGKLSFNLQQGQFLFPGQTVVSLPGNALLEARSFSESWLEGGKPLGVYVGLRKWNPNGENVTVLPSLEKIGEVSTRFVSSTEPEEAPDLHQGGPPAQLKHLYYALRIFWATEEENLGEYDLIQVAALERNGESVVLSQRYFPPALTLSASSLLLRHLMEIRDQLASRSHQLEAYKRDRGIHTAEFGARDMVFLLALRSLNRAVPLLVQMTEAETVHPWQAYGVLRQIIGELSSFSETFNVLGEKADGTLVLPPYNHKKLWPCFAAAQAVLSQLLQEITAGPEHMIELHYDGTYYAAELQPTLFQGNNHYYLVMTTGQELPRQLSSFTSLAKVGSRESLPMLIARALPGVAMMPLESPPQELPRRGNSLYFKIDHLGDQWRQVQRYHNIAVFWDAAPEDIRVELMVVGRS
ncbi:MAG: type VI secretion system-associated protein [Desulfobulbaceae bacterium A2]|nr:MAG: type VI secretion system-associated protein [Desulfobulbaceae bacterium A2]